ncbi:hypothetical protein ABKN59_003739 [Abortiporus biennis]
MFTPCNSSICNIADLRYMDSGLATCPSSSHIGSCSFWIYGVLIFSCNSHPRTQVHWWLCGAFKRFYSNIPKARDPDSTILSVSNPANRIMIGGRSCTLAYDVLVLVFTLIKTLRIRQMTLRLNTRPRLVTLLLRDGSIYFSLLLLMNVTQLGLSTKIQANVASPYFVPPITSILMSRFLLNLRRVHLSPSDPDLPNSISSSGQFTSIGAKEVVSTVQFSTAFLGNMAAPLHYSLSSSTTGSRSSAEIWDEPLLAGLVPVEVDHELEVIA